MERVVNKNIVFLTAVKILNPEEKGIYTDLLRKFRDEGHNVFVVCPDERKFGGKTRLIKVENINILYVRSLNLQKTGLIEKGLATLSLSWLLYRAIKKYFKVIKFDLILYTTPPITYNRSIEYLKKRDISVTYLLLKDIFPQNAVDLQMIKSGGLIHTYFRNIEKKLYALTDYIGCMSEANKKYIIEHNSNILNTSVEVNPNSIDLKWLTNTKAKSLDFKLKWGIDANAMICIYGGNLGKPQGIRFLIEVLNHFKNDSRIYFFIVGDGTEFTKINNWITSEKPDNSTLIKQMSKKDFDDFVQFGDSGLILLDNRFTIPNFPSRLLTYLENKMSVWVATDSNTDIGIIAKENNFGFWVENGDLNSFILEVENELNNKNLNLQRGEAGFNYLKSNYDVYQSYKSIINHLQ